MIFVSFTTKEDNMEVTTYTVTHDGHTAHFRLHGFGRHVIEAFNRTLAAELIKEAGKHDIIRIKSETGPSGAGTPV